MKTIFRTILAAIFISLSAISCTPDDDAVSGANQQSTGEGFSWTINGGTTAKTATTATYNLQGNELNLFVRISNSTVFEINLTNKIPGTYAIGNGNGFYYNFSKTENLVNPATGTITITSFANNKVSGTFTATGTGVGVTAIAGTFTNIGM